jgi:Amino acid permeases
MGAKHNRSKEEVHEHGMKSFVHRFKAALVISIPSSLIACTSPSVFLKAIDFAGSYPVLILWGVLPPLMALRSRSKMDQRTSSKERNTAGPLVWLLLLEFVSLFMVGTNVFQDVSHVWNNLSKL